MYFKPKMLTAWNRIHKSQTISLVHLSQHRHGHATSVFSPKLIVAYSCFNQCDTRGSRMWTPRGGLSSWNITSGAQNLQTLTGPIPASLFIRLFSFFLNNSVSRFLRSADGVANISTSCPGSPNNSIPISHTQPWQPNSSGSLRCKFQVFQNNNSAMPVR